MPSATKAEALVAIQEVIDKTQPNATDTYPNALKARSALISKFPPLGPLDMLYMQKRYVPVVGAEKIKGYYHFVRGVNPASVASVSAYIVDVVRNNGLDPLPWVSTGAWQIISATFVSFNIISKLDVTVHVDFPGSTSAEAIHQSGTAQPLTDSIWHELVVSSVIRDITSYGERPLYPCIRTVSPPSLGLNSVFDIAARHSASRWYLSGRHDSDHKCVNASKSRIAKAILRHFLTSALYQTAIQFFLDPTLCQVDHTFAIYAATAARMNNDLPRSESIVEEVIQNNPKSSIAWQERAQILRAKGETSAALIAATTASSFEKPDLDLCILLANLHVDLKEYAKAFESLNEANVPTPPLDPFLRHLVPNRRNLTKPNTDASRATDAVRILADRIREERRLDTEKMDDETLYELPSKHMTEEERECYEVLAKILKDLSWDEMLTVRSQCFVMVKDIEDGDVSLSDEAASQESPADEINAQDLAQGITTVSLNDDSEEEEETNHGENGVLDDIEERKRTLEKTGKKVCKPWLDYLVTNMYHDLSAMAIWEADEQHDLKESIPPSTSNSEENGQSTVSTRDVEAQESERTFQRTADELAGDTKRPEADWMRRGDLALRLGKPEEAKVAFWTCTKLAARARSVSILSLCRLIEMSSAKGDVKSTIRCVDMLWAYLDSKTRNDNSEAIPSIPLVRKSVFTLISKRGLRVVREALNLSASVNRKRLEGLLLDAVALRVDGFLQ